MEDSFSSNLEKLVSMGFKDTDAMNALVNTNSLDEAIEMLFSGVEIIGNQNSGGVYAPINVEESWENHEIINYSNSLPKEGPLFGHSGAGPTAKPQGISLPKTAQLSVPDLPKTASWAPVHPLVMHPVPPLPNFPVVQQSPQPIKPVYTKSGLVAPKVDKPVSIPGFDQNQPIFKIEKPSVNEDFKQFLNVRLVKQGLPVEVINEIVSGCASKEEALLILNIPMSLKDIPLSKIAHDLDNPIVPEIKTPENTLSTYIKSQLISEGIDPNTAEILSISCSSLEEAYANLDSSQSISPPQPDYKIYPHPPKFLNIPPSSAPHKLNPPLIAPAKLNPPLIAPPKLNPYIKPAPKINISHNLPSPKIPKHPPALFSNSSSESYSDELYINHASNRSSRVNLAAPSESDPVAPDLKTDYFERLQNYRLSMSEDPAVFQLFNLGSASGSAQSLKRINTEMKVLSTSVPCDSTASVFVVVDSACMHRIRFILSGTMDTPYAHGLYLFDALLPSNYPQSPPKVNIITTGNGKIRFNPNLYNNGYVCLSIIGTWSGRPEEQWNPSSSTLLQVILSIQSLVMDNDILQKEPSYHSMPRNSNENLGYQLEVKYGNLKYAMIEMIRSPPKGFETAVREHFRIKKKEVLNTARLWVEESKMIAYAHSGTQNTEINALLNRNKPFNVFTELYNELASLLNTL